MCNNSVKRLVVFVLVDLIEKGVKDEKRCRISGVWLHLVDSV